MKERLPVRPGHGRAAEGVRQLPLRRADPLPGGAADAAACRWADAVTLLVRTPLSSCVLLGGLAFEWGRI